MTYFLFHCTKTAKTVTNSIIFAPKILPISFFSSSPEQKQNHQVIPSISNPNSKSPIGSPCRVQKLISSQSDPLLAKEIFDYASHQFNFRHSQSSYLTLILKLGRAKHFSLIDDVLSRLKSDRYPVNSNLFTYLIKTYGEANLPDKALKTFYTMLEFNCKPLPKHLNRILEVLVSHRHYLRPAFDLFKEAHRYEVHPDTKSYNIMMRAFCLSDDLSIAYNLFNKMLKRDVIPDIESYRILMQGLCRKGQVNGAVELLEDMMNKGFVPDSLSYTTLLNSLCRKMKLKEAYKLLCKMKVKGCNPDIVHYNTIILGFCREGRAMDARKVLEDMSSNGCLPNLVSYRTLVGGLCNQGMLDEATKYFKEMIEKGFLPHFSASHALVKGFSSVGKVDEACEVMERVLECGYMPHIETWMIVVPMICKNDEQVCEILAEVVKVEIKGDTRIVEAGIGLEEYLIANIQSKQTNFRNRQHR